MSQNTLNFHLPPPLFLKIQKHSLFLGGTKTDDALDLALGPKFASGGGQEFVWFCFLLSVYYSGALRHKA